MAPRYSFQDIRVPEGHKKKHSAPERKVSIRVERGRDAHEVIAQPKKDTGDPLLKHRKAEKTSKPSYSPKSSTRGTGRGGRFFLWTLAGGTLIFLGISVAAFFAGATVTVIPDKETLPINVSLVALKDAGKTPYQVLSLSKEDTRNIPAGVEKDLHQKASGMITVYNEFGKDPQRLIKNTRFEAANKKIYRLPESIVVPGTKTVDGKTVAGSFDTLVYADEPGESYNQDLTQFTLPGLVGSPRYTKIYAKSKTPLKGGYEGKSRTASTEDINKMVTELKRSLSDELVGQLSGSAPLNTISYKDAQFFVFDDPVVPLNSTTPTLPITQKVTLYAVLFDKTTLTQTLASSTIPSYDGTPIEITNLKDLGVVVAHKDTIQVPGDQVEIKVTGDAQIAWIPPIEKIKQMLAGVKRADFQSIIAKIPHIKNASGTIRPPWQRAFPLETKDIKVVVTE